MPHTREYIMFDDIAIEAPVVPLRSRFVALEPAVGPAEQLTNAWILGSEFPQPEIGGWDSPDIDLAA